MTASCFRDVRAVKLLCFLTAFFFATSFFSFAENDNAEPSVKELSQTPAAEFYFSKKYPEALTEFQKLEEKYPANRIIKRYVSVLLSAMGRIDEAAAKLREIAALDPEDQVARRRLEKLIHPLKKMPADEFIKSAPAQAFLKGSILEALSGFESLKAKYPDDVLIRRFLALSQIRLKKKQAAIQTLEEALKIEPESKALHYYLAQACRQAGKENRARQEFHWVVEHGETFYKQKAERALLHESPAAKPPKKWGASLSTGYEFDTNSTFKSRDSNFSQAGDQNSSRYPLNVSAHGRFYRTLKWIFTADGFYSQNLYQDFNRLNTYTSGGGFSALYAFRLFQRPSFFNLREGLSHTFLKRKYYTWAHSTTASLIHDLTNRLRLSTQYRFALNQFQSPGTNSELTRRDGFDHTASLRGTYHLNQKRDFYFTLGYEYEHDAARGKNFIKDAHEGSFELNFPLPIKISGEAAFQLRDSDYPKYGFTPPPRRDKRSVLMISLSRPIFRDWTLTGKYTYEDSLSRNNLYEYNRHIFSVLLSWKH